MNAEMERLRAPGDGPFNRDGAVRLAHDGTQQKRGADVVVVRERYDGSQAELLNLRLLQIEGEPGRHGRRPVAQVVVDGKPVSTRRSLFEPPHEFAHEAITSTEHGQELQRLARLVGVAVERNPRSESLAGGWIAPEM